MIVKQAKALARHWVLEHAGAIPGFSGAYHAGSTNWLPDDVDLPATSDLDVMVVLADPSPPNKPGKFRYQDVLLEVTYLPRAQIELPERVLADYHLAAGLATASIIADPSGELTALQAAVARDYAQRRWVARRCEHARSKALAYVQSSREPAPFHDQVMVWLFGAGITTHVLLVAGLMNPTVRRRYVAVRELLAEYGRLDFHETLLDLLGCARMNPPQVAQHLAPLAEVFDVAKSVVQSPFPFASDISDVARPIAIDGSRELIERGLHREAIFWIVATYSRCQKILYHDAPVGLQARFDPGYRRLLAGLGIASFADLQQRSVHAEALLPQVWEVAQAIMAANPAIYD